MEFSFSEYEPEVPSDLPAAKKAGVNPELPKGIETGIAIGPQVEGRYNEIPASLQRNKYEVLQEKPKREKQPEYSALNDQGGLKEQPVARRRTSQEIAPDVPPEVPPEVKPELGTSSDPPQQPPTISSPLSTHSPGATQTNVSNQGQKGARDLPSEIRLPDDHPAAALWNAGLDDNRSITTSAPQVQPSNAPAAQKLIEPAIAPNKGPDEVRPFAATAPTKPISLPTANESSVASLTDNLDTGSSMNNGLQSAGLSVEAPINSAPKKDHGTVKTSLVETGEKKSPINVGVQNQKPSPETGPNSTNTGAALGSSSSSDVGGPILPSANIIPNVLPSKVQVITNTVSASSSGRIKPTAINAEAPQSAKVSEVREELAQGKGNLGPSQQSRPPGTSRAGTTHGTANGYDRLYPFNRHNATDTTTLGGGQKGQLYQSPTSLLSAQPLQGSRGFVAVSKAQLMNACDRVIDKNHREAGPLEKIVQSYPMKRNNGALISPYGRSKDLTTVQLSPKEQKELGIKGKEISIRSLEEIVEPSAPKSLRESLSRAWENIKHPNRQRLANKLLNSPKRHNHTSWNNLQRHYHAASDAQSTLQRTQSLRRDGTSEISRVSSFKDTLEKNPSDLIILPVQSFNKLAAAIDGRMGGHKQDAGMDFQVSKKHVGVDGQRNLRHTINSPSVSVMQKSNSITGHKGLSGPSELRS